MRPGPLKRKTPLKRGKPLKRGGALKRRARPARAQAEIEASHLWKQELSRRCANCGRIEGETYLEGETTVVARIEGHHIVRVQILKDYIRGSGRPWTPQEIAALLWDRRNRMPLCELCHTRHHRRLPALAWKLIEERFWEAVAFATELGLLWRVKLDYDQEVTDGN